MLLLGIFRGDLHAAAPKDEIVQKVGRDGEGR